MGTHLGVCLGPPPKPQQPQQQLFVAAAPAAVAQQYPGKAQQAHGSVFLQHFSPLSSLQVWLEPKLRSPYLAQVHRRC